MGTDDYVEILLVEDDSAEAELAIRTLKKYKLANNLVRVKDGEEALDFLFKRGKFSDREIKKNPRLILLDLRLPRVDGLEVLKEIKSNDQTKKIPVVILSTSKEERDIISSYEYGVNSFISKPVDFQEFVKVIGELGLYWLVVNHFPSEGRST